MAFSPFARFRNFTLDNLKAILEVYPDQAKSMEWSEATNEIEIISPGYKRTAYQQACQFGLEDRGESSFRIQNYLFTFDDNNLNRYLEFWFKIYFAPNPYVKAEDESILIYCEMVKEILGSENNEIKYTDFFNKRIGGKSKDILLNAIKSFAEPIKVKKLSDEDILFIEHSNIERARREVAYIEENLPIGDPWSRKDFFNRFSYANFCKFFGIDNKIPHTDEELLLANTSIVRKTGAENILFYGVPGAGKSHTIKTQYCKDDKYMERVVFHPDYTYSDFVGQILPRVEKTDEGDKLKYVFTPGPFTKMLVKAEHDPGNYYYLIIEEINRGNAPTIFGEIFQLLDRIDEEDGYLESVIGESEYGISNYDVAREVYDDETHQVKIPSNMFVLATMNTADQNVFTLDTAFQRRWNMKQIENRFDISEHSKDQIHGTKVTWGAFATVINELIIDISVDMASSEDKRLGTYFAKKKELSVDRFPEKVLKYLWDDVFKMDKETVFKSNYKSLEEVVDAYEKAEGDKLSSVLRLEVYKKMLTKLKNTDVIDIQEQVVIVNAEN